jgi:hypothetical protein
MGAHRSVWEWLEGEYAMMTETEFLILIRDEIDIASHKISIAEPLYSISAMIGARLETLELLAKRTQSSS